MDDLPPPPPVKLRKDGRPMKKRGFGSPLHPHHGKTQELGRWGEAVRRGKLEVKLAEALNAGLETLSDQKWQEIRNAVLLTTVTNPNKNAGASLKAIELMDRQRERNRFGTEEALARTLRDCEERLAELKDIQRLALERGLAVGRGGGAAGTTEDQTTEGATNGA